MRHSPILNLTLAAALLVGGCAQTPTGPTVQVMPAPHKPFEVFQQDQAICKQYASDQVAGQAESANNTAIGSTLLGAGLGAGLGAAIGGGRGAGIGAASGGLLGTAVGASGSGHKEGSIQQQYDTAYLQCMYAKGNQMPKPPPAPVVVVQPPPPAVIYQPPPPPPVYYVPAY